MNKSGGIRNWSISGQNTQMQSRVGNAAQLYIVSLSVEGQRFYHQSPAAEIQMPRLLDSRYPQIILRKSLALEKALSRLRSSRKVSRYLLSNACPQSSNAHCALRSR